MLLCCRIHLASYKLNSRKYFLKPYTDYIFFTLYPMKKKTITVLMKMKIMKIYNFVLSGKYTHVLATCNVSFSFTSSYI